MRNNKLLYPIYIAIFVLTIFSLFSNYKTYRAYDQQATTYKAISSGKYEEFTEDYLKRISSGYPNLTATAIPFNTMIGAHWINRDSIDLGMEYLRKGNKDNPYIGFSDMIFANVYQAFQVKDSFEYYAREATRKLPNNPSHFALLGRVLLDEKKLDSFVMRFNDIINRVPDRQIWKLYLSAMVTEKYNADTIEVNENARKAKSIFPQNNQISLTADYVLYGVENVKKSIELNQIAIDTFEVAPNYSINAIKQAIEKVPDNITYYETLIEMQFRIDKYQDVIDTYEKLNELKMTNLRANIIEFISISFLNTNNKSRGCYLAKLLEDVNWSLSPGIRAACSPIINPN